MEITDTLQKSQGFFNVTLAPRDDTVNQYNKDISIGLVANGHEVNLKVESEQHDKSHKRDEIKSKTCPWCRESFMSVKRMDCHKSIAHEQEDNTSNQQMCYFCGIKFIKTKWYHKHMRTKHSYTSSSDFKCNDCQRYYIDKGSRNKHMRTQHAKALTLNCEICQEQFENTSKTNLNQQLSKHMSLKHPGIPFVKCQVCPKLFLNKAKLYDHKARHKLTNICDICGKGFSFPRDLPKHYLKIHGTEDEKNRAKKFVCTLCNSRFYNSSNLKWHTETHTSTYNFQCDKCEFRSKTSQAMRQHDGKKHLKIWGIITQEQRDFKNAKKRQARHSKKVLNGGLYRAGEERKWFNNYMREFQHRKRISCEICLKETTNIIWHKKYMCSELKN